MIRSLRLKNLALVEDLRWELGAGFNILTGETGAGKSMLIGAINLILGERADKTLVRTGETTCTIEAEIELSHPAALETVNALLADIGAEACEDKILLLKRSFTTTGSNKQFANGSGVTQQGLRRLSDLLVDVHGPHDHQSLLSPEKQTAILDAYGKLDALRGTYSEAWDAARHAAAEREKLNMSERERMQKLEMLRYQTKEIEDAALTAGEDAKVEHDYKVASNARSLQELAGTITGLLSEGEPNVLQQLALVERALNQWQRMDSEIASTAALNRSAITALEELASEIADQAARIEDGAISLPQLEERLGTLQRLKRKYGPELSDVIRYCDNASSQIVDLESSSDKLEALEKEEAAARQRAEKAAAKLTAARRSVAGPLAEKIQGELRGLGFNKALFRIDIRTVDNPTRNGADHVEFIFAPNVGEDPQPLRNIASSGEMARVMLAIKTTLAAVDEVPILVFDEVDANVGGETAIRVGEKLRQLGASHQVLCITHLPQVAAQGDRHFAVSKQVKQGRSHTQITVLEGDKRVREIARMLGGESEQALALATSLINGTQSLART
ncbi:MAG TPA: DNA repair protein RecN [Candidatus Methylacidiphilales bacterium]|nr:DNA repair protein RecN [Candidatus Methylacidiphilales bacterium]